MADPATLTAISMGTTALGSLTGAFGSMYSGESSAQMYQYQSGVAKINTQIAKQNADYSRRVGEVEAQQSGMKSRAQVGEAKVIQAASGLDVSTGSAADVRSSQVEVGQHNQAIIRSNAAKRAYGHEVEALQSDAQSKVYEMAARKSRTGGQIGAIGSILGGASSISNRWLQAKQTGIFGEDNPRDVGSGIQLYD